MKTAVIDLGTNTFNLLIRDNETAEVLINTKIAVKLGEGGLNKNEIAKPAFDRGIAALRKHKKTILEFGADQTYAFATSAIRSASNGNTFVKEALKECNISVNVIDGQKEAELIYFGVKQALPLPVSTSLIMDIGGGSTEFIIADSSKVHWIHSFNLGASRLLEKFQPSNPITTAEIKSIEKYLDTELSPLWEACADHSDITLIGSSGSFDTMAAMVQAAFPNAGYNPLNTTYTFEIGQFEAVAQKMLDFTLEQRLATPGMIPMRADMIVMACIQINFVLQKLGVKSLKLSTYALKEGVFFTLNETKNPWQKSLL
ncbi:exopolyphosphatase [Owenweeksia hongkongensis DSM 17368]|uniref:Exopolyphosphatase n=1 Tax=Owenweeksia hongkongensis (strain DSM 17368 / CIP 108786 / JCM 12287 / NRRL B-23963 / UST20020801) TaxID=926562 RepID=G8R2I4_OWEHD|nr:exopolyphosphatase [Owenweeksia hongkongensis]AEV33996.1 exopolyphosphatase [Owenweeksia hongkongensis DSM 17368]